MTHEVIIYRNPMEQDIWHFWYDNPMMVIYLIGCMIAVVALFIIWSKIQNWFKKRKW